MNTKDIATLRHDAHFCTKLAEDVFWVPVSELGASRYTAEMISGLLALQPEEKQAAVSTLYEAMQLFLLGGFREVLDVEVIHENGIGWEHHKPGYYAVKTNCGCCASTGSWLAYILAGRYEEMGLITFLRPDCSGHVFNYILRDSWYYFIDLMPFTAKYAESNVAETGLKSDFVRSRYLTGVCVKSRSLADYVTFFERMLKYGGVEFCFFKQKMDCASPIHAEVVGECVEVFYPRGADIVQLSGNSRKYFTRFVDGPAMTPDWQGNSICGEEREHGICGTV